MLRKHRDRCRQMSRPSATSGKIHRNRKRVHWCGQEIPDGGYSRRKVSSLSMERAYTDGQQGQSRQRGVGALAHVQYPVAL
ncbi:hypothetical protein DPMN_114663 [Dreissena polymorpha]|uniref:Uncharacterized protein n=1 Tax=Dreissena polymorpha TaxID=45954 RepID=A0A9D4KJU5_DREPO|nr:hypothetical protein DPMN_114663 [Dreissena polymorpha]